MNIRTIRDFLIDAVRLDREIHEHVGPARLRAQQLPYTHGFADMAGWGKVPNDKRCQLKTEDGDPYQIMRAGFWDQFDRDPTPSEISRADVVQGWFGLVDDDAERRALVAWLKSKVGGTTFRRWCLQHEGISVAKGTRRKNRALDKIFAELARKPVQDNRFPDFGPLRRPPEISDVSATIATAADDNDGLNNWAAADAVPTFEISYESGRAGHRAIEVSQSAFSWAAKRNARRRQQRARKAAKEQKKSEAKDKK